MPSIFYTPITLCADPTILAELQRSHAAVPTSVRVSKTHRGRILREYVELADIGHLTAWLALLDRQFYTTVCDIMANTGCLRDPGGALTKWAQYDYKRDPFIFEADALRKRIQKRLEALAVARPPSR